MALTFEAIELRGKVQDVVVVEEGVVIQKTALTGHDIANLEKAEAKIDGDSITTLKQALEGLTLKNGFNALEHYAAFLVNVEEANAAWRPRGEAFNSRVWAELQETKARLDALEEAATPVE